MENQTAYQKEVFISLKDELKNFVTSEKNFPTTKEIGKVIDTLYKKFNFKNKSIHTFNKEVRSIIKLHKDDLLYNINKS